METAEGDAGFASGRIRMGWDGMGEEEEEEEVGMLEEEEEEEAEAAAAAGEGLKPASRTSYR